VVQPETWTPPAEALADIRVTAGSQYELEAFRKAWTTGALPEAFCADILYGLRRFYFGYWEGEPAHISWLSNDRWTFNVHHRPDEWEIRDVFTLEPHRGRGIAARVLTVMLCHLKAEHARRVFVHVEKDNHASERTMSKVGMRRIGTIRRRRVMGIERVTRRLLPEESQEAHIL